MLSTANTSTYVNDLMFHRHSNGLNYVSTEQVFADAYREWDGWAHGISVPGAWWQTSLRYLPIDTYTRQYQT